MYIINGYNKEVQEALLKASRLSRKNFLDRIWNNFILFEVNSSSIGKQIKRDEFMSVNLLFNENIKIVLDFILANYGEFSSYKWFGSILKSKDLEFV